MHIRDCDKATCCDTKTREHDQMPGYYEGIETRWNKKNKSNVLNGPRDTRNNNRIGSKGRWLKARHE